MSLGALACTTVTLGTCSELWVAFVIAVGHVSVALTLSTLEISTAIRFEPNLRESDKRGGGGVGGGCIDDKTHFQVCMISHSHSV